MDVILLSDSLEYFFNDQSIDCKITRIYQGHYKSLKYISTLNDAAARSKSKCIAIDSNDYSGLYENIATKITRFDSENWQLIPDLPLTSLFHHNYLALIEMAAGCVHGEKSQ